MFRPSCILTPDEMLRLHEEHSGRMCAYLARCLRGDMVEAEDIVQAAFLKAWEGRGALRAIKAARSWLYTIATNELRARMRRPRLVTGTDAPEPACERPSPERSVASGEELERVLAAVDALPEEQREAVLLVRMHEMPFAEAAAILGAPENTVKTRVRRGLLRVEELLRDTPA